MAKSSSMFSRRELLMALAASAYAPIASAAGQFALQRALSPAGGGRIDAQTVKQLIPAGGSIDALMTRLLPAVQTYARPPISKYMAAAVALGKSGALYAGANFEFIKAAGLSQTVHAEQAAVANAFNHRETGVTAIAVNDAPCGLCRQFLNELAGASSLRVITPMSKPRTLKDLLPDSFGPKDLQQTEALFASTPFKLRLPATASGPVAAAALDAATRSYAPYSKSPSGCAVQTKSGTIASGSYLENAAFNPSFGPLQSALVSLAMRQEQFADITRVALVETAGMITQAPEMRIILGAIAPRAAVDVIISV